MPFQGRGEVAIHGTELTPPYAHKTPPQPKVKLQSEP